MLRVTKTFRSCIPAWLEMDRKVCPTATTSLHITMDEQNIFSQIGKEIMRQHNNLCVRKQ